MKTCDWETIQHNMKLRTNDRRAFFPRVPLHELLYTYYSHENIHKNLLQINLPLVEFIVYANLDSTLAKHNLKMNNTLIHISLHYLYLCHNQAERYFVNISAKPDYTVPQYPYLISPGCHKTWLYSPIPYKKRVTVKQ